MSFSLAPQSPGRAPAPCASSCSPRWRRPCRTVRTPSCPSAPWCGPAGRSWSGRPCRRRCTRGRPPQLLGLDRGRHDPLKSILIAHPENVLHLRSLALWAGATYLQPFHRTLKRKMGTDRNLSGIFCSLSFPTFCGEVCLRIRFLLQEDQRFTPTLFVLYRFILGLLLLLLVLAVDGRPPAPLPLVERGHRRGSFLSLPAPTMI